MKNVFRGLSAKLALALLAVGTMTSCYEKEELDKTPAPTPEAAKYYIQGNVLDVENGQPLNAAVTVDGATVPVNNGYYRMEIAADNVPADGKQITIVADMDNYFTATKTAYLPKTVDGSVTIATVDFALVGVKSQVVEAEIDAPANADQAGKVADAAKTALADVFAGAGLTLGEDAIEVAEDGSIVVTAVNNALDAAVAGDVEAKIPLASGFASTITPADDNLFTKALTDGKIWVTNAEKALGMVYGMKAASLKHTFKGVQGAAIASLIYKAYYSARTLAFNGVDGVVMYQDKVVVTVTYQDHDNHDGHDWHDAHNSHEFGNPGAGGGSSAGE